jgi:hypothetical protein
VASDTSLPENLAGRSARVNPGWFEQNNLPRPENAAPAATLMLAPRERKCQNRRLGRFL